MCIRDRNEVKLFCAVRESMFRATVEDVIERIRLTDIQFVPRVTNEDVLAVCVHCTQQRALYFRDFSAAVVKELGQNF